MLAESNWRDQVLAGIRQIIQDETVDDFRSAYLRMSAHVRRMNAGDPEFVAALDRAERELSRREAELRQRFVREALGAVARTA